MKGLSFACGLVVALAALAAPFQALANDYFVMAEDSAIIAKPDDDPAVGKMIFAYKQSDLLPPATSTFGGVSYNSLLDDATTNVPDLQKFIDSGKQVAQKVVNQAQAKVAEVRPAEPGAQFTILPGRPARLARRADRVDDRQTRGQDVSARLSAGRTVGLSGSCGAGGCSNGSCSGGSCGSGGSCNQGACNSGLQFNGTRTVQLPGNSCGGSCGGVSQQSLPAISFTGERTVQLPGNSCGGGSCGSGSCGSGSCGGGRNTIRLGRNR